MESRIRILIVDDHPMVRKGLTATISPEPDMEVVGAAASAVEAVELFRNQKPDITIMDLGLTPEMTGTQAIQAIRKDFPDARIIVLSGYKGDDDIVRAMQAGATTYLLKETVGDDLIPVIREVHSGGRPVSAGIGKTLADRMQHPGLSGREVEVLQQISKGKGNKEIGAILHISEDTVQGHVKNIFLKLKVRDRTEAVVVGVQRGFLRVV
jgi:DNA-binding NarL/FixJ family response regulator